jgi:hypothetical protein
MARFQSLTGGTNEGTLSPQLYSQRISPQAVWAASSGGRASDRVEIFKSGQRVTGALA